MGRDIALVVAAFALIYLIAAFVSMEANVAAWSFRGRSVFVVIGLTLSYLFVAADRSFNR